MNRDRRISHRSVGQFDPKNWFDEGDGLLASAAYVREAWQKHRKEFSETVQERRAGRRDAAPDWNLLTGLPRASMLLLGYAVEMYLKAGLAKAYRGCSETMFTRDVKQRFGHKLRKLSSEIAFPATDGDAAKLRMLEDMIRFDARYPVAATDRASYADGVNRQTEKIWGSEAFTALAELAKRVCDHSRMIDADTHVPALTRSFTIDDDGYLTFRVGGHLPPRITFRWSSVQEREGTNSLDGLKALFPGTRYPWLTKYWKRAWIYEDQRATTRHHARPPG